MAAFSRLPPFPSCLRAPRLPGGRLPAPSSNLKPRIERVCRVLEPLYPLATRERISISASSCNSIGLQAVATNWCARITRPRLAIVSGASVDSRSLKTEPAYLQSLHREATNVATSWPSCDKSTSCRSSECRSWLAVTRHLRQSPRRATGGLAIVDAYKRHLRVKNNSYAAAVSVVWRVAASSGSNPGRATDLWQLLGVMAPRIANLRLCTTQSKVFALCSGVKLPLSEYCWMCSPHTRHP